MGLQRDVADVIASLPLPTGFAVCELGDQGISWEAKGHKARAWYESRGCGRYVSIDGNGQGTHTADLNLPLNGPWTPQPSLRLNTFDLVTDLGTGEHIFDQAQVWRTLHALAKPGGFIAFDRPATGYGKHCFYLTNECLFRDLAAANRYDVVWMGRATQTRGELIRGVFRRVTADPFRVPQQGKYAPDLVIGR